MGGGRRRALIQNRLQPDRTADGAERHPGQVIPLDDHPISRPPPAEQRRFEGARHQGDFEPVSTSAGDRQTDSVQGYRTFEHRQKRGLGRKGHAEAGEASRFLPKRQDSDQPVGMTLNQVAAEPVSNRQGPLQVDHAARPPAQASARPLEGLGRKVGQKPPGDRLPGGQTATIDSDALPFLNAEAGKGVLDGEGQTASPTPGAADPPDGGDQSGEQPGTPRG